MDSKLDKLCKDWLKLVVMFELGTTLPDSKAEFHVSQLLRLLDCNGSYIFQLLDRLESAGFSFRVYCDGMPISGVTNLARVAYGQTQWVDDCQVAIYEILNLKYVGSITFTNCNGNNEEALCDYAPANRNQGDFMDIVDNFEFEPLTL